MGDPIYSVVLVFASVVGLLSTIELARMYRKAGVEGRARLLLAAFVAIAGILTIVASYFGGIAVRRLIGFPPLDWTPGVSFLLACIVFAIPPALVWLARYIAAEPTEHSAATTAAATIRIEATVEDTRERVVDIQQRTGGDGDA